MIQVRTRTQWHSVSSEEVEALQQNAKQLGLTVRKLGDRRFRHGRAHSKLWRVWKAMLERCYDPKHKAYPRYRGRGIQVCLAWHTFVGFYADMGERPEGYTLERKNCNGHYCKANYKWATWTEQQNNRCDNHMIEFNGKIQTIAEWAREKGMQYDTLEQRLRTLQWSVEKALTKPVRRLVRRAAATSAVKEEVEP